MSMLKRIFITGVMTTTVMSMSIVLAPTAKAAASAGDLIKISSTSSVYYLGTNGKRYVFPNEATYFSWYKDFSNVVTISQSEMETYSLAANVTVRPGTKLIKSPSNSAVYAVEPGGKLRSIVSEANAINLYGANWAKNVVDVIDSFFVNYTVGTPLTLGQYPQGQLIKTSGSADVYLVSASQARKFGSEAAFLANGYNMSNVVTVASSYTMPSTGSAIAGAETSLTDVSQGGVSTGPVSTGSGLTAVLGSDTPASTTIPAGVSKVGLMNFNLTASNDGDVVVSSVTITRGGLGSKADFTALWIEQAGARLTSNKTLSSNDQAVLTFSPALTISAGKTVTLSVYGSVAASNLGANDMLSIASASDITASGATVSGSFPVAGNLMSFTTSYAVNIAEITPNTSPESYNVGDEDVVLGSFALDNEAGLGSSVTRDTILKSVTFKNMGNADLSTVAANLALEKSGVKVSDTATIDGKYVTFTLANDGLAITKGDNITLKITGDITSQDASNSTIQFELNKSSDMDIEEASTGFAATVATDVNRNASTATFTNANSEMGLTTLTAGNITISKESTSPTGKSYVRNTKDVTILLANVKANQAFNADGMMLDVNSISTAHASSATNPDSFDNIRLYVNGNLVDSKDEANISSSKINYDSSVSLNQGDNEIKVVMDVTNDAADGENIILALNSADAFTGATYVTSGDNVLSTDIGGSAIAGKATVGTASLTATRNDGFVAGNNANSDKKIVRGTTDVVLGTFAVKALNDNITVNSITLAANTARATKLTASHITNLKLIVAGSQIGGTKNMSASGVSFNLGADSLTVNKDTTKTFTLLGTIDSSSDIGDFVATTATIFGIDSNGKDLTTNPTVSTVEFVVTGSGSLTVSKNGDTKIASLLSANKGNNEVARFKLTASNDDLKINKIYISNMAGTAADPRISAINIYNGSTLLGTGVPTNGEVFFDISSTPVTVKASQSVVLTAKVDLNDITDASQTGKDIQLAITGIEADSSSGSELDSTSNPLAYDDSASFASATTINNAALASDTTATSFVANSGNALVAGQVILVGDEQMLVTGVSSNTITVTRGINSTSAATHATGTTITKMSSIAGNSFRVYKTIPTIALQALPSTVLTTGSKTVLKFTVAADANADVTIKSFFANVSNTGVTLTSTTGSLKVDGSNYTTAAVAADNTNVTKVTVDLSSSPVVVAAGTSRTFEVVLPVSSITTTNGATASITSSLGEDANFAVSAVLGTSTFVWSDNSDVTNYATNLLNSFEVFGLPTDTQSLSTN